MDDASVHRNTVVVGVDGAGWAALDWAARYASVSGARLLVCVAQPYEDRLSREALDAAEEVLATARDRASRWLPPTRLDPCLRHGDPATELAEAARGADMVVVGSPGRIGWPERVLGSPVVSVIARARARAAVVRPDRDGPPGPYAGHVVVGVDLSAGGDAALRFAFEYAAARRLPLAAVRVATDGGGEDYWFDERMLETHFAAVPGSMSLVAERVERLRHRFPEVPVKLAVSRSDDPGTGLLRAASGAQLLAIGQRDADPGHDPLGPVALTVLLDARCPVAVLRQ